jgi:hypothetical protein
MNCSRCHVREAPKLKKGFVPILYKVPAFGAFEGFSNIDLNKLRNIQNVSRLWFESMSGSHTAVVDAIELRSSLNGYRLGFEL